MAFEDSQYENGEGTTTSSLDAFFERIRAIPKPVWLLLAVVVLATAGWLFFSTPQGVPSFRVTVRSATGLVEGASVEAHASNGGLLGEKTTSAGTAVFQNLPLDRVEFRASKAGIGETSKIADTNAKTSLTLFLGEAAAPTATPAPTTTITPPKRRSAILNSTQLAALSFADASLRSRVLVLVTGADGAPVNNAEAALIDAASETIVSKAKTLNGYAVFSDAPVGLRVAAVVQKEGFVPARTNESVVREGATTRLQAQLLTMNQAAAEGASAVPAVKFNASDIIVLGDGKPLFTTSIFVVDANKHVAAFTDENNPWSVTLPAGSYTAVAASPKRLYGLQAFQAGENVTLELPAANDSNAANLTVSVLNPEEKPADEANVALFTADGTPIPIPFLSSKPPSFNGSQTDFQGQITLYYLPRGDVVLVRATKDTAEGDGAAELPAAENVLEIRLSPARGTIVFNARDAVTGAPIDAVINMTRLNQTLDSCETVSGSCTLDAPARVPLNASIATPNGYFPLPTLPFSITANEVQTLDIPFIALNATNSTFATLLGFFDANGRRVDSVRLGENVEARFLVASKAGQRAGFFATVDEQTGGITGNSPNATAFRGGFTANECAPFDVQPHYESNAYAWVELSANASSVQQALYAVKIGVSPSLNAANVTVFYRSFLDTGNATLRNPADAVLNTTLENKSENWCQASTLRASLPLASDQVDTNCSSDACVTATFEQKQFGETAKGGEGFVGYAIGDCLVNATTLANCSRSAIIAKLDVVDLRRNPQRFTFRADSPYTSLSSVQVSSKTTVIRAPSGGGAVTLNLSSFPKGSAFEGQLHGTAVVLPLAPAGKTRFGVTYDNGVENNYAYNFTLLNASNATLSLPPLANRTLLSGINDCPFNISISADPELGLLVPCKKLGLLVDQIFPADAVALTFRNTEILLKITSSDGSDGCYEYDARLGALKYNTEKTSCPDRFKASVAGIRGSNAQLVFGYSGEYAVINVTVKPVPLPPESAGLRAFVIKDVLRDELQGENRLQGQAKSLQLVSITSNNQLGTATADLVGEGGGDLKRAALNTRTPASVLYAVVNPTARLSLRYAGKTVALVARAPPSGGLRLAKSFSERAKSLGALTAFRRNGNAVLYCEANNLKNCRPSLSDWTQVIEGNQTNLVPCNSPQSGDVFCNQVADANGLPCDPASNACTKENIPRFDYDARCTPDGVASIPVGEYFWDGSQLVSCGFTQTGCTTACELINPPSCNSACSPANNYTASVPVGTVFGNGFGNVTCDESSPYFDAETGACRIPCFNQCQTQGEAGCQPSVNLQTGDVGQSSLGVYNFSCGSRYDSLLLGVPLACACLPTGTLDVCRVPCANWKGAPNCNPDCNAQGFRPVQTSYRRQVWLNQSNLVTVPLGFEGSAEGYPYHFFKDDLAAENYTYLEVVDTTSSRDVNLTQIGIPLAPDAASDENCRNDRGIYLLQAQSVNGVAWSLTSRPLQLNAKNYASGSCRDARTVPLCDKLYAYVNGPSDACVVSSAALQDTAWTGLGDGNALIAPNAFSVANNGVAVRFDSSVLEGCYSTKIETYSSTGDSNGLTDVTVKHSLKGICNQACWGQLGTAISTCVMAGVTCASAGDPKSATYVHTATSLAVSVGVSLAASLVFGAIVQHFANNPDSAAALAFLTPALFLPPGALSPTASIKVAAVRDAANAAVNVSASPPAMQAPRQLVFAPRASDAAKPSSALESFSYSAVTYPGRSGYVPLVLSHPAHYFWQIAACVLAAAACAYSVVETNACFHSCGGGTDGCSGNDFTHVGSLDVRVVPPTTLEIRSAS